MWSNWLIDKIVAQNAKHHILQVLRKVAIRFSYEEVEKEQINLQKAKKILATAMIRRLTATEKRVWANLLYQTNDFEIVKNLKNFEKTSLSTNADYERLNIWEDSDEIDFLFEYWRLVEISNVHSTSRKRFMNLFWTLKSRLVLWKTCNLIKWTL